MANSSTTLNHENSQVAHHFVDADQQLDSAKMGMWIFLVTEILFFGGLFLAYIVYRAWYPELYSAASDQLDTLMGSINTIVLIGSSVSVAFAIRAAQTDQKKKIIINLAITLILATTFMVIKYFEYMAKFEHGVYPGGLFDPHGAHYEHLAQIPYVPQFFSIYFVMTGIHGAHVLIGMAVIGWVAVRAWQGAYSHEYYTPVELTGLYWHLVDIVWIFLFPMLYLI